MVRGEISSSEGARRELLVSVGRETEFN